MIRGTTVCLDVERLLRRGFAEGGLKVGRWALKMAML